MRRKIYFITNIINLLIRHKKDWYNFIIIRSIIKGFDLAQN
jgi:hypothetical protein